MEVVEPYQCWQHVHFPESWIVLDSLNEDVVSDKDYEVTPLGCAYSHLSLHLVVIGMCLRHTNLSVGRNLATEVVQLRTRFMYRETL